MTVGERIKLRRKELGMSADDVAAKIGKDRATVYRYECCKIENMPVGVLEPLASALDTTPADLMGWENAPCPKAAPHPPSQNIGTPYNPIIHKIPILGRIAAGLPLYSEEHIEGYTYTEHNGGAEYFALKVKGDSMNAAHINDGSMIIVRRQPEVENGQIAVVRVDKDDATVKRFRQDENIVQLIPQSYNPEHQIQIYDLKTTDIEVIGKVVECKMEF